MEMTLIIFIIKISQNETSFSASETSVLLIVYNFADDFKY